MAKRKRSQHPSVQADLKKQRVDAEAGKPIPNMRPEASSNAQGSVDIASPAVPSKSALKRRQKIARRRERRQSEAVKFQSSSSKARTSPSRVNIEKNVPSKTADIKAPAASEKALKTPKQSSGKRTSDLAVHNSTVSHQNRFGSYAEASMTSKQHESEGQALGSIATHEGKGGLSKTQRRRRNRQKGRQSESFSLQSGLAASKDEGLSAPGPGTLKIGESQAQNFSSPGASLRSRITRTNLLPRPSKQWIQQDVTVQEDTNADLHRDVTKTNLLGRPTKELVQHEVADEMPDVKREDVHSSRGTMTHASAQAQKPSTTVPLKGKPLTRTLAETSETTSQSDAHTSSVPAARSSDTGSESSISISDSASKMLKDGRLQSSNVTSTNTGNQKSAEPENGAITSHGPSWRQHTYDLPSGKKAFGLSQLQMNPSSFGNSIKSLNSSKASSVPSHMNVGDAKAAFRRFAKFAHNRDESESEDSNSSDESDSDSRLQVAKPVSSAHPAAETAGLSGNLSSGQHSQCDQRDANRKIVDTGQQVGDVSDLADDVEGVSSKEAEDLFNNDQPPSLAVLGNVPSAESHSGSSESSASESTEGSDEEVPVTDFTDHPADTNDKALGGKGHNSNGLTESPLHRLNQQDSRMQDEAELHLFSDFHARHPDTFPGPDSKRTNSFLGYDQGGNRLGASQNDELFAASLPNAMVDADKDDIYQSIDDISREVFGSTLALPDCKLPTKQTDASLEPSVTENLSNHGLKQQLLGRKTEGCAIALSQIPRSSSPMVWIVNSAEIGDAARLGNVAEDASDNKGESDQQALMPLKQEKGSKPSSNSSISPLSSLSPSPEPQIDQEQNVQLSVERGGGDHQVSAPTQKETDSQFIPDAVAEKRKMTGATSKHFSPQKSLPRKTRSVAATKAEEEDGSSEVIKSGDMHKALSISPTSPSEPKRVTRKQTGKSSAFFTPTASPTKPTAANKPAPTPRPPKGTSTCPVPPTTSHHFGLIQEKLWHEPFWLLIAVTFLNKTAGRAAAPIFWSLKDLYPTPEALSQAHEQDLVAMISTLGLQNQRARRLIAMAKVWMQDPPVKGRRHRTLHYPAKGDGKGLKREEVVEEDADACEGALEIGRIPGCGPYAWDSWRIFCRDVVRGLAEDYNGKGAAEREGFLPEWQRVLPLDKELRACLRWMWLREGWVWDCETGEKRLATEEEREDAKKGEMVIVDEQERKFAREAAWVEADGDADGGEIEEASEAGEGESAEADAAPLAKKRSRRSSIARRELGVDEGEVDEPKGKRSRRGRQ